MAEFYNEQTKGDYEITKDDFKLVQKDKKITDEKFQSKPTTFFKDCLRRFRKNKSSVAGAIVLGILIILAIFYPVFSQSNITTPAPTETLLAPKLFAAGTGFWDGTEERNHYVYDIVNQQPADVYLPAVLDLVVEETPTYVNQASPYGTGGYFHFVNQTTSSDSSDLSATKLLYSNKTTMTANGEFKVSIVFGDTDGLINGSLGEYRIYLSDGTEKLELQPYSKNYNDVTLDLSKALKDAGITTMTNARLYFELKAGDHQVSYILIKKCEFTCASSISQNVRTQLEEISITDATRSVLYTIDTVTQTTPTGYWASNGQKNIYQSEMYYCSYRFDTYAAVYDVTRKTVASSQLQEYINKGWCSYNATVGPSSFKKLSDKCPIETVYSQNTDRIGKVNSIEADVCRYKELGYDSMPIFLFGTDNQGHDIVKKAFAGLRTSLILGLCTAVFCLAFGLVWGAISGYFGGNVDLAMERFCDILGGIPTIVVLTLCILHLGNTFGTFVLALCLTGWMGTAGRTRTQFYRFKGREYVLASRTLGASDRRLIFRHILPNALGTIVTGAVLMIPSVIYSEATLAYLNLGLQGLQSFGVMLSDNQIYIGTHPALIVFPSVIMALMMISFNLFGNGLRDALNPSLKGSD